MVLSAATAKATGAALRMGIFYSWSERKEPKSITESPFYPLWSLLKSIEEDLPHYKAEIEAKRAKVLKQLKKYEK